MLGRARFFAVIKGDQFAQKAAQGFLGRFRLGHGAADIARGKADAGGENTVYRAFAKAGGEPSQQALADDMLNEIVGQRQPPVTARWATTMRASLRVERVEGLPP